MSSEPAALTGSLPKVLHPAANRPNRIPIACSNTQYTWYRSCSGRLFLLLGGRDDDKLFQLHAGDLTTQLDRLERVGGNIIAIRFMIEKTKGPRFIPFIRLKIERMN